MSSDYEAITKHNERQLGLDTASRKTQICMYSDSTHFVYEILQNADDYGATEVFFKLSKNELLIEHNGEPFKEENVKAITYFGKSTSRDDLVKTGRFGVGFKSVFAFTGSPIVISGNEHFQIYGLYRVREYPYPSDFSRSRTRIVLPFNHDTEQPDYVEEFISKEEAYSKISTRLTELNMNTLLFTRNICEIRWEIGGRSGHYLREDAASDNGRWTTITNGEQLHKYLVFSRIPKWKNQEYKAVEIAFAVDDKSQLMPTDDFLYVLFATTQETHLQFILNGPFRTNPSRETISEEDHFNVHLMKEACSLMRDVLQQLREIGLLTIQFLAVLPNNTDNLRAFYTPLLEATVKAFREYELVPTHSKEFAPAQKLYHGHTDIREVISDDDLQFLANNKAVLWAAGVMQNSRQEKFLRTLGIQEWGWEDLINGVEEKYDYRADNNEKWLLNKKDEWMQRFYILLKKAIDKTDSSVSHSCKIVRLQSGEHVSGNSAFFPDEENKKNKNSDSFPRVKLELLRGQRKQGVRQFLEAIGVKEVRKKEEIEHILKTYYSPHEDYEDNEVSHKQHIAHMKKFISHWTTQKEDAKDMFSDYEIFYDFSGVTLRSPEELYLDMPYLETGLSEYFQHTKNNKRKKYKLWSGYKKEKLKGFETFVQTIGVMTELEIVEHTATALQSNIFPGRKGRVNKDFFINGLEYAHDDSNSSVWSSKHSPCYIGTLDLSRKNIYLSMLIWRCMCNASPDVLSAIYKTSYTEKNDSSYLVKQLKAASWIPDKNRKFRKPADMTRSMLHKDFPYDDRNGWLTAIGFGENERKETEEYKNLKVVFKKIGLSRKVIEMIPDLAKLPEEQQIKIVREVIQQSKAKTCFPSKEAPNPERRALKIAEKLAEAPPKTYSIKDRSVRTSNSEVRPEVKTYLRNLYTNDDNEMICQICEKEMPFKLADGSYYFEAVECVENFPKECKENYIALCPVCAAKFKHVNNSKPKDIRSLIIKADELTIPITLARESKTIRFVKMHLEDLKAIFKSKSGM